MEQVGYFLTEKGYRELGMTPPVNKVEALLKAAEALITAYDAGRRAMDHPGRDGVNRTAYALDYEAAVERLRAAVKAKGGKL